MAIAGGQALQSSFAADQASPIRLAQSEDPFKKSFGDSEDSGGQSDGSGGEFVPPAGGASDGGGDPILDDIGGSNSANDSGESGSSPSGSAETASPETTDVEAGTANNSEGQTKVIYHKDKNGRTTGVTYVHTNAKGEETGRDYYPISPDSPDGESGNALPPEEEGEMDVPPVDDEEEASAADDYRDPAPVPDGTFAGDFAGDAAGEIRFTINGNVIQGSMRGRYSNAPFRVQFQGRIDENGAFTANASGTAHTTIDNVEGDYPVGGTIEGNVANRSARGYWSGKASTMMSNAKGTWSASQYP
jgi:hypothetical protein